ETASQRTQHGHSWRRSLFSPANRSEQPQDKRRYIHRSVTEPRERLWRLLERLVVRLSELLHASHGTVAVVESLLSAADIAPLKVSDRLVVRLDACAIGAEKLFTKPFGAGNLKTMVSSRFGVACECRSLPNRQLLELSVSGIARQNDLDRCT